MTCQRGDSSNSKRYYGNNIVKARLYSLSSDIMYLYSAIEINQLNTN